MLESLYMKNFTAFDELELNFSPGINIFIGSNGTGKTHILKLLYTPLRALSQEKRVSDKIVDVFLPKDRNIGRLVKRVGKSSRARIKICKNNEFLSLSFSNHTKGTLKWSNNWNMDKIGRSVYIPVKEMLANSPGFQSLYNEREIYFEEIYSDILYLASIPPKRGPLNKDGKELLKSIQKIIEGKVVSKNEEFFLKNKSGELEFTLLAEGMRKLALLWILIQNGTLLRGSKLFWDEPEANLNPFMLKTVVEILLLLQKNGVQIFIATHNYVLLKEFDLQKKKNNKIKYFSLYHSDDDKKIVVDTGENYLDVLPNKIAEAYDNIYKKEIKRSLGDL